MPDALLSRLFGRLRQWRGQRDSTSLDQRRDLLDRRLESPEQPSLRMARRHVWEGERRVTRQAQVYEEMLAAGKDVDWAEAVLASYLEFLRVAREHLKVEEMKATGYAQDVPPDVSSGRSKGDL